MISFADINSLALTANIGKFTQKLQKIEQNTNGIFLNKFWKKILTVLTFSGINLVPVQCVSVHSLWKTRRK